MTDLQALLKRVEEATGSDRKLDVAIGVALDGWEITEDDFGVSTLWTGAANGVGLRK